MTNFEQPKPSQTTVITLGMHRSGTSCLAGSLQQKGLFLDEVFEWNPFNLKGNRENEKIMNLNDSVLLFNGASWDNPPKNISWNAEQIQEKDKIICRFISSNKPVFGFKDPRAVFTLPFWLEGLSNIKLVGSFRNPLDVAKSLNKRNGWSIADGLKLWEKYNLKLVSLTKSYNLPLVNFDVTKSDYVSRITEIAKYLHLDNIESNNEIPFYDEKLISGRMKESINNMPKSVKELYSELLEIYITQRRNEQ